MCLQEAVHLVPGLDAKQGAGLEYRCGMGGVPTGTRALFYAPECDSQAGGVTV